MGRSLFSLDCNTQPGTRPPVSVSETPGDRLDPTSSSVHGPLPDPSLDPREPTTILIGNLGIRSDISST